LSALALLFARKHQMQAAVAIIDLDQGRADATIGQNLSNYRAIDFWFRHISFSVSHLKN